MNSTKQILTNLLILPRFKPRSLVESSNHYATMFTVLISPFSVNLDFFKDTKVPGNPPFAMVAYEKFYFQSLINNQYTYLDLNKWCIVIGGLLESP